MSTGTLPTDLPRSLLIRRIRREVDVTVTDYMRLGDWDEQLAVSVVERMLHHKNAHGVMCYHWAALIDKQPGTNSSNSPMQAPPQGLASQAAEVARRVLLQLLPSRPELFTSSVHTLLLGVLHFLIYVNKDSNGNTGSCGESSQRQLQHFIGSQQQHEDTVECALQVLEGTIGQQQQLQQQPKLLAPAPAMRLLAGLCKSGHAPLLRSSRCVALASRYLFNPHNNRASTSAAGVLDLLVRDEVLQEETSWACNPILFTSTVWDMLGYAEACMVWHAAYGNAAFAQAARVPFNKNNSADLEAFHFKVAGCGLVFRAMFKLPIDTRAGLLMRRPGLLRALCTLCDSAGRNVAACGASPRAPGELWFDVMAKRVFNTHVGYMFLISASPHPGPAHVRALELGLSCLLRMCERAPRLKATTTSAVLFSFEAWISIFDICDVFGGSDEQSAMALDMHRARAALEVLSRTHALVRLLQAAVRTERWLEGRPRGLADVSSRQPCRVVDALLSMALLTANSVSLVSAALGNDGIDSTAGQQQRRQQQVAHVQRVHSALLAARESYTGGGGTAAALPCVPAQVQELVRDLQRAIAALAPHGNPDLSGP